jgi:hypothetical protein
MDITKLFSTLPLTGEGIPPRSTTRPAGKPKFVKFLPGDNGEGMPETFFEGQWFNSCEDEPSKYPILKILAHLSQNLVPMVRFRPGVYFRYVHRLPILLNQLH